MIIFLSLHRLNPQIVCRTNLIGLSSYCESEKLIDLFKCTSGWILLLPQPSFDICKSISPGPPAASK